MKNKISVVACIVILNGCVSAPQNIVPVEKTTFLGWDENGHKKSNVTGGTKINNDRSTINSTILNEDTIICETVDSLSTTGNDFIKREVGNNKFTGTFLFDGIAKRLESIKDSLFRIQISNIQYRTGGIRDLAIDEYEHLKKAESEKTIKEYNDFLKTCTVNKEAKPVDVIERKPISKVAKIKVKLNDSFYEFWTYEDHLTFK